MPLLPFLMDQTISITALASVSPLGASPQAVWEAYKQGAHCLEERNFGETKAWVASISAEIQREIDSLAASNPKYGKLDRTVLYALFAARKAVAQAGWNSADNFGINMGSSRGATALFEKYYEEFLDKKRASTLSSPTTTLGNISSWVAHDLQTRGPEISHSITCSTALHALLNGVAWIKSGMTDKFLVGGSEAPLTPFTIAQIQALKIYARGKGPYPCRALDMEKRENSMVLGEGAAVACLEKGSPKNALARIEGMGYATEPLESNTSISTDAVCFQQSMKMALGTLSPDEVDVIVMHAPGTLQGDSSEKKAIEKVFCNKLPFLTTNKWKIGHTFGASGLLSIELAIFMLRSQTCIPVPYVSNQNVPENIQKILVNAVGFGGNAVSILLSKSI